MSVRPEITLRVLEGRRLCLAPIIMARIIAGPISQIAVAMEAYVKRLNAPNGTVICTISALTVMMAGILPELQNDRDVRQ